MTGIEYNPQGQAIVERAHTTLKQQIKKLRRKRMQDLGMKDIWALQNNPRAIMHQALFKFFFNLPQGDILTRAEHFMSEKCQALEPASFKKIWVKTAVNAEWVPAQLLVDGRGYGLVSFQDGHQQWIPGCWIKARRKKRLCREEWHRGGMRTILRCRWQ